MHMHVFPMMEVVMTQYVRHRVHTGKGVEDAVGRKTFCTET